MTRFTFNRQLALQLLMWLLLLVPLAGLGLAAYLKHQQLQTNLDDLETRYARLRGMLDHQSDYQALNSTVNAELARLTYPASQDLASAANDAQQRVRSLFADNHLDIISIQVLPAKQEGAFNRITITLRVEGNLVSLYAALEQLPSLSPAVFFDSMTIQTIGSVRPASDQKLGGQFTFSAFRVRA